MSKAIIQIGAEARVPKDIVNMIKLRRILTIVSKDSGYGNYEVRLFREEGDFVYIPRYYALKIFSDRFDTEIEYIQPEGTEISDFPDFVGTLRPAQLDLSEMTLNAIKDPKRLGGIINMAVGSGKTCFALWLASKLKLKTLVIVHKEFLMNQWITRILGDKEKNEPAFLPGARVGKIQQDLCLYENKHIVLGMVHSLAMRDNYPKEMYDNFGLLICDETHRMASPMFSQAAPKFNALYKVGLTATVKRKDLTQDVFIYHIGPIIARHNVEELAPKIKRVFSLDVRISPMNHMSLSRLITYVSKNDKRNMMIAGQIVAAVKAGRKIIVMSHRLNQLDRLRDSIMAVLSSENLHMKYSVGSYVGGMSQSTLDNSAEKDIILSTYNMTMEGLDLPKLDTIVMGTPKADIHQSVGRILRKCESKKDPIVVDIVDTEIPAFMNMYRTRLKFYQSKNWI